MEARYVLVKEGKHVLVAASALQWKDAEHARPGDPLILGLSIASKAEAFAINIAKYLFFVR